jgi:hypothetical protein
MDKSRWTALLAAAAFLAAGLFPMLDALGVFPGSETRMQAPRWVVLLVGGLFFFGGLWLLLVSAIGESRARSSGVVLGVVLMMGLALVANWLAFGGGDRSDCSGALSIPAFGYAHGIAEIECRAAFGYGALLLDLVLLRGLSGWWERGDPGSRAARALSKGFGWGLGALLLPLVLLVVLLTKTREGAAKLAEKMRKKNAEGPPLR